MMDFYKKESSKKAESGCCGVEIRDVKEEDNNNPCCVSNVKTNDSCCSNG